MERTIAAWVLGALALASRVLYDHRGRRYARAKLAAVPSPTAFRYVYAWVRWTTLIGGLGALLSDHPVWLTLHRQPMLVWAGITVAGIGFVLFVWAKTSLGAHYSPCFDVRVPNGIVERGAYARIRHPIYTANLLQLGGLTLATGSLWLGIDLVVIAAYYVPSARREERTLLTAHPEYCPYMQRTGRFLPRLGRTDAAAVGFRRA